MDMVWQSNESPFQHPVEVQHPFHHSCIPLHLQMKCLMNQNTADKL